MEKGYHQITNNMRGFFARPDNNDNVPVLIIIQEIFGVNHVMRDTCIEYANKGFNAICPDLFHRLGKDIQLTDKTEADWKKAFGYYNDFDIDLGMADIQVSIEFGRKFSAKVGTIGYCLGGTLAYLSALQTNSDAIVSYYGIDIANNLEASVNIKKPVMLHIAQDDEYVPNDQQQKVIEHFKNDSLVTTYLYENAKHAFARIDGINFDKETSNVANKRTIEFLKENLS